MFRYEFDSDMFLGVCEDDGSLTASTTAAILGFLRIGSALCFRYCRFFGFLRIGTRSASAAVASFVFSSRELSRLTLE